MESAKLPSRFQAVIMQQRFPRSSQYDTTWLIDNAMGPNVLWLAEWLCEGLELRPGMRVLDLGCGKAISSIFLAKEFDVTVCAADLWIRPTENMERIEKAAVADRVAPMHVEAHGMPFSDHSFDLIVSFDAYHYFGTDDLYLGHVTKFLKPGGTLGIVVPGVAEELNGHVPDHVRPYWEWEFCSFHSPNWWRTHWRKTGLVDVERSDWLNDGWNIWEGWMRTCAEVYEGDRRAGCLREAEMLNVDAGRTFGFVRVVARRPAISS